MSPSVSGNTDAPCLVIGLLERVNLENTHDVLGSVHSQCSIRFNCYYYRSRKQQSIVYFQTFAHAVFSTQNVLVQLVYSMPRSGAYLGSPSGLTPAD